MKLLNRNGNWKYGPKIWIIPKDEETSCIKDYSSNNILHIEDNSNNNEPNVVLCNYADKTENDLWSKGIPDVDGWFVLKHQSSGKVLTALTSRTLVLSSM